MAGAAALITSLASPGVGPAQDGYWMAHQLDWIRDQSKIAVCEKPRRSGMSHAEAFRVVDLRFGGRNTDHWYAPQDESASVEFIDYVAMFARDVYGQALEIIEEDDQEIETKVLSVRLPEIRGRRPRITAMTSNPSRFRSKGGDVTLDEFAHHPDQRGMWKAAFPTIMWGGTIRVLSTHKGVGSFFNEPLVMMGKRARDPQRHGAPKARDYPISLHAITIYDVIANGIVERINAASGGRMTRAEFLAELRAGCLTEETWAEEFECNPSAEQDSFLPYDLLRPCVRADDSSPTGDLDLFIGDIEKRVESFGATDLYAGCDVARRHDLFVIDVIGRVGGMKRTLGVLAWQGESFGAMEMALARTLTLPGMRRLAIDATGMGMQLAERMTQSRYGGGNVEAVTFTAPIKEQLASLLRRDVEERTVTFPDDPVYLADLNALRKSVTAAGNVRYDSSSNEKSGLPDYAAARMLALHAAETRGPVCRVVELEGGVM